MIFQRVKLVRGNDTDRNLGTRGKLPYSPQLIWRGLGCLRALLFCVCAGSSVFCVFVLCILVRAVLAVEFVVVLWSGVCGLCALCVLKGEDGG